MSDHHDDSGKSSGFGVMIFLIILVCFGGAAFMSSALGDPAAPAIFQMPVQAAPRGYASGLEETAVAARLAADADSTWRAAGTAEAYRVAGQYAQSTEFAYRARVDGWTATADSALATSTASAMRQAYALSVTQTLQSDQIMFALTREAATAVAKKNADEQRRREIDLRSSETMIGFWAVTKWVILVVGFGALCMAGYRWFWKKTEYKEVHANAQGKYPGLVKDGQVVNMNLQVGPVMSATESEKTSQATQLLVKQNDQQIDLVRSTPANFNPVALRPAQLPAAYIEIIDPATDGEFRPILDEVEQKLLMQGGVK